MQLLPEFPFPSEHNSIGYRIIGYKQLDFRDWFSKNDHFNFVALFYNIK